MMPREKLKFAAGAGLLALWLVWLVVLNNPTPPFEADRHVALGRVMGEECLKLLSPGGRVVLIVRDTRTFKSPAVDAQRAAFLNALRRAKVEVASTNLIKSDPLRVPSVPAGDFFLLLKSARENDVVVSFNGPPTFADAQAAKLGGKAHKVLALCTGAIPKQADLPAIFRRGILSVAVLDREGAARPVHTPPGDRGLFDHWFQIATPSSQGTPGGAASL